MLTIPSSFAQDESRSISENSTWGIRKRFEQGKIQVNHKKFLGYTKDEEENLVINKKQADIIKRIYRDYLAGKGPNRIANWRGKTKWYGSTIKSMLSNEKYKDDAILQKTYTVDFLTKKRAINKGEIPMYYIEGSHPAIIDKDMWEAVQLETRRRQEYMGQYGIKQLDFINVHDNPLIGRVIWGECGNAFGRKTKLDVGINMWMKKFYLKLLWAALMH